MNSYTDCKNNITFRVGEVYDNFMGKYRIEDMEIDPNNTTAEPQALVQYVDLNDAQGQPLTQILNIREQGRYARNTLRRFEHYPELSGVTLNNPDFIKTMGYMARYGRIRVECPSCVHKTFEEMYEHLTHDKATNHFDHGYAIINHESWDARLFELRITFPIPRYEGINLFNMPIKASTHRLEINYLDFVINLFKMGFTIGENYFNIDRIYDRLPDTHKAYFLIGMNALPEKAEKVA